MNGTIYFCSTASSLNVTPDYWNQTYDCKTYDQVTASFLLVYIVIGLPWNVLVLLAVVKGKHYQQPLIVLLLTILVTDILILMSTSHIIITEFAGEYVFGSTDNVRCVTYRLFVTTSCTLEYCSSLTIISMTVDRFLYVYKPLQYERLATPRKMLVVVVVIVAVCIFIGLMLYFSPTEHTFVHSQKACISEYPEYVNVFFLILDIIIVVFVLVCNAGFSCIALSNIRKVYTNYSSTGTQLCCLKKTVTTTSNRNRRINRLFCGFILPSLVLSPVYIITYWTLYCIEFDDVCVSNILPILLICPTVTHPLIETWLIPDVRNTLKEMVTRRLKVSMASAVDKKRIKHCSSDAVQPQTF